MLSIKAANKRHATEGVGVKRPKKRAKPKRPRGTKFINFTCELDKDNCILDQNGLCIAHKTPANNPKVGYLVNPVDAQLGCGYDKKKVDFKCDVCFHVFSITLNNVTNCHWCGMCSSYWKHCGVETCTFCFERSLESYKGLTLNDKKKADCTVKKADLRLALGSHTKVKFKCDVCLHVFSMKLNNVIKGRWCGMCSNNWKHCGVETCTFCFNRSIASYKGLTLNDKKKADCTVKKADLRLALGSHKKVKFKCDVCSQVFSMTLNNVTNGRWCPTCKNKTELMVLNLLQEEMNIKVVTQYIPGGMKQMKKNYGKFGKLDYHLPNSDFIWELDGAQHNLEVAYFKSCTLFTRMILDKWKEYLVKKEKLKVIRFDQVAIWQNKYDWKQEMENILTFTSDKLRRQLKTTKKRYKMYAKQHNDKSKRRSIPEKVKRSHKKAHTHLGAMFTIMSFITKYK
jgi:uncharacterized ferredoxin-like protein